MKTENGCRKTESGNRKQKAENGNRFPLSAFRTAFCFLITVFYLLLPVKALTGEPTYNFPATLTSPSGPTQTIPLSFPFDTLPTITPIDLGHDGTSELLLGSPPGYPPQVRIIRQDGSEIVSWFPYGEKFQGRVAAAVRDEGNDGRPEIVTAPIGAGGPHLKVFNTFGKLLNPGRFDAKEVAALSALVPTEKNVTITIQRQGESWRMILPRQVRVTNRDGQLIMIDLSDQKLSYYQDGFRIATHQVSTGRWNFPTPIGEFAIQNKIPRAYSKTYGLYMPWWMAFYRYAYGIHELPEWPNGTKEGTNHLGIPVSHGCIRLGVGPAKEVYDWAEVGTKVIVQK